MQHRDGKKGVWGHQVALCPTSKMSEKTCGNQNGGFPHLTVSSEGLVLQGLRKSGCVFRHEELEL